ncbi:unnamed protein product [Lathyrus sativus]|nr:unnamed protein product [Lathyrus sativus]
MTCVYFFSLIPLLPSKFPNSYTSNLRPTPIVSRSSQYRRRTHRKMPGTELSGTVPRSASAFRLNIDENDSLLGSRTGAGKGDTLTTETDVEASSTSKTVLRKNRYSTLFGIDLSPDTAAVAMVYFVQGVLGLARLAVSFYLKDGLHLDPAEVVDSMVVERARGESQSTSGSLQSLCWGSSAFGGIVSSYFSGSLLEAYGARFVFGVTALLPLLTSAVAVLVKEQPTLGTARGQAFSFAQPEFLESSKQSIIQLWVSVRQPSIFLPTLFIFLWQATPQSDSAMFYFNTNSLGFTPEFLGRVKLVTSIASLLGVGLYNGFLKNVPLRKIFLWTTIFGSALGMTQVFLVTGLNRKFGISDEWFAIGDSLILTVLSQASFMPVLVLAARLCPEGMEATLFATLMSVSNGGSVLGGLIGAGLTQVFGITKDKFDNLAALIILCNLSSLLPLPLLGLLPGDNPDDNLKDDDSEIEMKY